MLYIQRAGHRRLCYKSFHVINFVTDLLKDKAFKHNLPSVVSALITTTPTQCVWSFWVACSQILMKHSFDFNGEWKKWWPNAVLLKPKKWEHRAQQCHVTALIWPELLFCVSPPFLSSSRLSPSLWIPITVAVEGGLVTRKHKHCEAIYKKTKGQSTGRAMVLRVYSRVHGLEDSSSVKRLMNFN